MIDTNLEKEIKTYVNKMSNGIKWNKLPKEYEFYLLNRFNDCHNTKEAFLRIKHNIYEIPICPICKNNKVEYVGIVSKPYNLTCENKECKDKLRNQHVIENNIKKYGKPGHTNPEKCKQTKLERYGDPGYSNHEKARQTKLERYGDPGYTNPEKCKQTCLEKYGVTNGGASKKALEKIKQTNLERYGVISSFSRKEVIEKARQTKLERYGDPGYTNPEKCKQTCLEKYGVTNGFMTKQAQEKYKQTMLEKYGVDHNWKILSEHDKTHTKEAWEKRKQTTLKNYGVEFPAQSEEIKKRKRITHQNNINNNYVTEETKVYNMLISIYPNTIRQYGIDDRYPYQCDFYIPELDMFIEYNGFITHGQHPYNENNIEDIKYAEWLKQCKFAHYDYLTFIKRDPEKRKCAKINNLNYVELWSLKDAKNFIKKLSEDL